MKKIAFRVDGGKDTGMGHVMRSLSLASAFPDKHQIVFIVNNEDIKDYLKYSNLNIKTFIIGNHLSSDEEINKVRSILKENDINILITDSYNIDQQYLSAVKKEVELLVSIHDFAPFSFPSDIVINGNVYAADMEYKSLNGNTKFLLGTKYLLMRKEFIDLPKRELSKDVSKVLVTVGGGDPLNLTTKIIRSMKLLADHDLIDRSNIQINIVIGPAFTNKMEIIRITKTLNLDITLHINVHKMSDLMLACDMAVSAGGSTLYELAAAGTPAIAILQSENQFQGALALIKKETIINLGRGDMIGTDAIANNINKLMSNFQFRRKMSQTGQKLVDGRGAERCAQEILRKNGK